MADLKISQLTSATTPLAGTELVPVVQGGVTKKVTAEAVAATTQPSGTANGVAYLNSSKVLTTGSALTFDGDNLGLGVTPSAWGSGIRTLDIGFGSALTNANSYTQTWLSSNAYYTTQWLYKNTAAASYYDQASGRHTWYTAPSGTAGNAISFTQAMTLDASGNLLVGATSQIDSGSICLQKSGATSNGIVIKDTNAGGGNQLKFLNSSGTTVGYINQNGTATTYSTTSDQRLKENIQDADNASTLIDSLKVRQFDWKADGSHQRYGFVAQELVTVAPEAVHQPEDPEQMMAVDYSKLVPMLVKEIQSLRARVAQLEGK